MHERQQKISAPSSSDSNNLFCYKYKQMSFKEELRRKKLSSPLKYMKKIDLLLNSIV